MGCWPVRDGSWARLVYTMALWLATPWIVIYLLYRSLRQPEYRLHWNERFARGRQTAAAPGCIWIHAVSVGETRAAQPLIEALERAWPERRILLTHTTPTGRATSVQLFGDRVERRYLAYDYPGASRRFLAGVRPAIGILMETELWPNLLAEAGRLGVPMVLANARLSARSERRALRFAALARPALAGLAAILAQSAADAERFANLGGVRIWTTGNLKFDVAVPTAQLDLAAQFRMRIGGRLVLLCASTREGEESLLLAALGAAGLPESTLVVLVPRHPQRFGEVAGLLRSHGFAYQCRSDGRPVAPATRVWLGDSMGEMFAYYGAADLAYVGGGLLPFGTQNLIEACAVGCPVIVGPHTFNFAQAADDAIAAGAAVRVADAPELMETATRLLASPDARRDMAERAERFACVHRGATERTVERLLPLIPV